jgi:hypothetical protein
MPVCFMIDRSEAPAMAALVACRARSEWPAYSHAAKRKIVPIKPDPYGMRDVATLLIDCGSRREET